MKELKDLTERELLLLTHQEMKRVRTELKEYKEASSTDRSEFKKELKEELKEISGIVVKHEKFKNTLIGATLTSLTISLTALFRSMLGQ